MPTVHVNGIDLYYEQHGAGSDVLLIMGLGAHAGDWARQVPALARHFRVTVFDNRGCGRSSAPDEPYSIRQMADDAVALMDALDMARAHVVGSSMGGEIAQELAISYPERVDRLVLIATSAGGYWARIIPADRRAVGLPRIVPGLRELARQLRRRLQAVGARRAGPAWQPPAPPPPPAHGLRRQREATAAFDAHGRLSRISAPTLVIAGARDREVPLAAAEELARGIPGARLVVLRGAGHLMHYERADEVNRLLLDFLRASAGGGAGAP